MHINKHSMPTKIRIANYQILGFIAIMLMIFIFTIIIIWLIFFDFSFNKSNIYTAHTHVQKPPILKTQPVVKNPLFLGICKNSYVIGIYIVADSINRFVYFDQYHSITIVCANNHEYKIKKKNNYKSEILFLDSNGYYFVNNTKKKIKKCNLLCNSNEIPVGISYNEQTEKYHIICKNTTGKINMDEKYYSPIFGNVYGPGYTNIYTSDYIKKTVYCENYFSTVYFISEEGNRMLGNDQSINFLNSIDLKCRKDDLYLSTSDTCEIILVNKASVNIGNIIDTISYFVDDIEFKCDKCPNRGSKHIFECPENTYIAGHIEWHRYYSFNHIAAIQFICK